MNSRINWIAALLVIAIVAGCGGVKKNGATVRLTLRVAAPTTAGVDVPVHVPIDLPPQFAQLPADDITVVIAGPGDAGATVPGQIVLEQGQANLWWVIPRLAAGRETVWVATLSRGKAPPPAGFTWRDSPGDYLDLLAGGRKVTRYVYAYDPVTPERYTATNKPFHHVFDAQGENLLTNGPGDGLYPHHRGLFIGWTAVYRGEEYNFWSPNDGRAQVHQEFLQLTAGPVLAISKALIHWNDQNGEPVLVEERETTVFRQTAPTILLLDFRTRLTAINGAVVLEGNAEHAGFQFRAHSDVAAGYQAGQHESVEGAEVSAQYLFHAEGIDPREDMDLPWVALSFGLHGRRYSVQHMNHPDNPRPTVYSAYRTYGRFGASFNDTIASGETMQLRYGIWVGAGEFPERELLVNRYTSLIDGPRVAIMD